MTDLDKITLRLDIVGVLLVAQIGVLIVIVAVLAGGR